MFELQGLETKVPKNVYPKLRIVRQLLIKYSEKSISCTNFEAVVLLKVMSYIVFRNPVYIFFSALLLLSYTA